jgi:hypothetical protein
MGIREYLESRKERRATSSARFKEAEEELKIHRILEERQKSANQRELERFMKEKNEETIKHELEEFRKQRDKEISFGHNPINTKNVIKGQKNIFKNKSNLLGSKSFLFK